MITGSLNSAIEPFLSRYEKAQICIVADKSIIRHDEWLRTEILHELPVLWLETSEANKSIRTVTEIWDFLLSHGMTRRGLLVCMGGGVLTDMAGFASATYKRGMDYITIPTTLLAMIDASTGGKTGINYNGLKNCIGVFAPPVETIVCPSWLSSLPDKQLLSGFAEMMKTGLIGDESLWLRLMQYDLEKSDIAELTPLIADCISVKQSVVAADPRDTGIRKSLNFGHTFGHALEEMSLGAMPHGYAVLYGMIAELYLSVTLLDCPREALHQLTQCMLHYYGRPNCNCKERERLLQLMYQDKKNEHAAEINCTLLQSIGKPVINRIITPDQANEALDYLFSL